MKLLFSVATLAYLSALAAAQGSAETSFKLRPEDNKFWDRFLKDDASVSIPPEPSPTPPVGCMVDVTVDCKLPDGTPCDQIVPPDSTQCADGSDIQTVSFSFQLCTCDPNANNQGQEAVCEDTGAIDFTQDIQISCVDADGGAPMDVSPTTVSPEGVFSVNSPGGGTLPDKIVCDLTQNGSVIQTNVVDVSGDVSLNLGDKFGALQLESCDDDRTCIETVCYNIDMENVGTSEMDITKVETDFDGEIESWLDDLDVTTLQPGQSTSLEVKKEVDICVEVEYCFKVDVEATPPSNLICNDEDEYKFSISTPPPAPTPPGTAPPTPAPTPPATAPPTPAPTPSITAAPTPEPTPAPTPPPTELCILSLDLNCTIGSGEYEGRSCDTPGIGVEPCRDRPTGATMLFNGGDCSQSDNRQFLKFTCVDTGTVPTEEGEMAYIVVTDAKGKGIVYHRGYVAVGTNYYLRTPEAEERFEADQRIMIYANEDTGNPANLLQEVQYHSSCSSNLELKNRFGASQLVEFQNELQGNVTCFATAAFDLDIVLPVEIEGTSATIEKLTALTNFAGFLDLTDQVAGIEIPPGGSVKVSIPVTFDLTVRMRYTILTQVTAVTNPSGQVCTGTDFNSFYAGNIPPGSVPTLPPAPGATVPPPPTSNAIETACGVSTGILCEYLNRDSRVIGACEDVPDPRTVSCTDDLPATGIEMRYTGTEPVTVIVEGGRSGVVFDGIVNPDEVFRADGDFRGEAEVSVEGGESYSLNLGCAAGDSSLTLGNAYGPFVLTGFVNSLGLVSTIHDLRVRYTVANTGGVTMVAEQATCTSSFQDAPIDALSSEQTVETGAEVVVFEEVEEDFDFLAKFSAGTVNTFSMAASGRGSESSLPCSSETTYSF